MLDLSDAQFLGPLLKVLMLSVNYSWGRISIPPGAIELRLAVNIQLISYLVDLFPALPPSQGLTEPTNT